MLGNVGKKILCRGIKGGCVFCYCLRNISEFKEVSRDGTCPEKIHQRYSRTRGIAMEHRGLIQEFLRE